MANQDQLEILKQGSHVWNEWRSKSDGVEIDFSGADLEGAHLSEAHLGRVNLSNANLRGAFLTEASLSRANLNRVQLTDAVLVRADLAEANLLQAIFRDAFLDDANLRGADLREAYFNRANLIRANLDETDLGQANFSQANLSGAHLGQANFNGVILAGSNFSKAFVSGTIFRNSDLSGILGLETTRHFGPSNISTETFVLSRGKIPDAFLRGCGLSDVDVEYAKLSNPELSNEEINKILYKIYDLRATQALQFSPLFISYSHTDSTFVDKLERHLNQKGIRFWRDTHDMKSGRLEKQIDQAITQNPTVVLVLSEHSLKSDWVEHEVRKARVLEKEMGRDVLCPIALDDSWTSSPWPERIMEQVMEYNILDFSAWKDDLKFVNIFNKLIDGLELFYK